MRQVGNTIYISVVGILTIAAQARASNQWRNFKRHAEATFRQADLTPVLAGAHQLQASGVPAGELAKRVYDETTRVYVSALKADLARGVRPENVDMLRTVRCAGSGPWGGAMDTLDSVFDIEFAHVPKFELRYDDEQPGGGGGGGRARLLVRFTDISLVLVKVWWRWDTLLAVRAFPFAVLCFALAQLVSALRSVDDPLAIACTVGIMLAFMVPAFIRGQQLVFKMTD